MKSAHERPTDWKPLIVYSLVPSMALNLAISGLAFAYGGYLLALYRILPYPWAAGIAFLVDFYLRLWRRPVRKARFFDSHIEISGWKVNINAKYQNVENLTKFRQLIGDFRSDTRISFTVKDDINLLVLPDRWNRKLGLDVYSLFLQKGVKGSE